MRAINTFRPEKRWLLGSLVCFLLLIRCSITEASDPNQDILNTIVAGVEYNDSLINNVSFDYIIDRNVSDEWRNHRLERIWSRQPELPMTLRPPTLEHTVRTGVGRFERKKMYTTSNIIAVSDGKIFEDEIISHDGTTFTKLNLLNNHATISRRERLPLSYDVRKYALSFADGEPLYVWLTSPQAKYTIIGTEELEGTRCWIVERARTFFTPDGRQETSRARCWIAPAKGFLVKKAILFDVKSPGKILTITKCQMGEVEDGIWYYSNIRFESYPLSLKEPDITVVVELGNFTINQALGEDKFKVVFPAGCFIDDQVAGRKYRVGQE